MELDNVDDDLPLLRNVLGGICVAIINKMDFDIHQGIS